jgi:hypothetical protein
MDLEVLELDAALCGPALSWPTVLDNWGCLACYSTVLVDTLHRHHFVLQLAGQIDHPIEASIKC